LNILPLLVKLCIRLPIPDVIFISLPYTPPYAHAYLVYVHRTYTYCPL